MAIYCARCILFVSNINTDSIAYLDTLLKNRAIFSAKKYKLNQLLIKFNVNM